MLKWLILQQALGYGRTSKLSDLISKFKDAEGILNASKDELKQTGVTPAQLKAICSPNVKFCEKLLEYCNSNDIQIIHFNSNLYPNKLRYIDSPPVVLFVKGEFPDFNNILSVGIIATRNISDYGKKAAFSLAAKLSLCGAMVVSGGALGGDSMAHLGVTLTNGRTVIVPGGGVNADYLQANKFLRDKAVKLGGALVSEFVPCYEPKKYSFPLRNRIVAGLCDAVVVIESPEISGTTITANLAMEYGKDVYAVPGRPDDEQYKGCNRLINNGAYPLISVENFLSHYTAKYPYLNVAMKDSVSGKDLYNLFLLANSYYSPKRSQSSVAQPKEKKLSLKERIDRKVIDIERKIRDDSLAKKIEKLNDECRKVYECFADGEYLTDEIVEKSELPTSVVLKCLTKLEIKGLIVSLPGSSYRLK